MENHCNCENSKQQYIFGNSSEYKEDEQIVCGRKWKNSYRGTFLQNVLE